MVHKLENSNSAEASGFEQMENIAIYSTYFFFAKVEFSLIIVSSWTTLKMLIFYRIATY